MKWRVQKDHIFTFYYKFSLWCSAPSFWGNNFKCLHFMLLIDRWNFAIKERQNRNKKGVCHLKLNIVTLPLPLFINFPHKCLHFPQLISMWPLPAVCYVFNHRINILLVYVLLKQAQDCIKNSMMEEGIITKLYVGSNIIYTTHKPGSC